MAFKYANDILRISDADASRDCPCLRACVSKQQWHNRAKSRCDQLGNAGKYVFQRETERIREKRIEDVGSCQTSSITRVSNPRKNSLRATKFADTFLDLRAQSALPSIQTDRVDPIISDRILCTPAKSPGPWSAVALGAAKCPGDPHSWYLMDGSDKLRSRPALTPKCTNVDRTGTGLPRTQSTGESPSSKEEPTPLVA